jgi:hypothetical protein
VIFGPYYRTLEVNAMWRRFFDPFALFACYLPMLLMLGTCVLLIVLPALQAPRVASMVRYTRKVLRGRPDASDGELRRLLRARFLPDWATEKSPEVSGSHVFLFGLSAFFVPVYFEMRSYLLLQVMEERMTRAIELADS